jgi:hypothetical protein
MSLSAFRYSAPSLESVAQYAASIPSTSLLYLSVSVYDSGVSKALAHVEHRHHCAELPALQRLDANLTAQRVQQRYGV